MEKLFDKYGVILTDNQKKKFEKYYELLTFYNEKFNITAITEKNEVIIKHFIDSALGQEKVGDGTLIDIGSGGGFPAIPLKIMNDKLNVTLLEATGKKCEFLKVVIKELELKDINVLNGRAEDFSKDKNYREKFDICTARAVAKLNTLCEYCLPFVKVGGKFVAYKGDAKEEVKEAKNAITVLGAKLREEYYYDLEEFSRALITIEKVKNTDLKYPRGNGKERKNPL